MTEKSNDPIDSSRNRGEFGTQTYNHQNINTAFLEGVKRLEGKFVSKMLSRCQEKSISI